MENEEDILNVDFDPTELDNIDEDALLGEPDVLLGPGPPQVRSATSDEPSQCGAVTTSEHSCEQHEIDDHTAGSELPDTVDGTCANLQETPSVSTTDADDTVSLAVDAAISSEVGSKVEEAVSSASTSTKKSPIVRDIPDSLDKVKLPKLSFRLPSRTIPKHTKLFNKRSDKSPKLDSKPPPQLFGVTAGRVLLNPHFKDSHSSVIKPSVDSAPGLSSATEATTEAALALNMQPTLQVLPPPTSVPPSLSSMFAVPPPCLSFLSPVSAGLGGHVIDTSRPPPSLIPDKFNVNKTEWLGATEDFLRKTQLKEPPSSSSNHHSRVRYDEHRRKRAIESLHRRYGGSDGKGVARRSPRKRRRSTSSSSSRSSSSRSHSRSRSRSISPPSLSHRSSEHIRCVPSAPAVAATQMVEPDSSICDDDYLRLLEEQKRKREEMLQLKKQRRIQEVAKKQSLLTTHRDSPAPEVARSGRSRRSRNRKPSASAERLVFVDPTGALLPPAATQPASASPPVRSMADRLGQRVVLPPKADASAADRKIIRLKRSPDVAAPAVQTRKSAKRRRK